MSIQYSPRIATNGLILALDAGNTKSYQSGSTSWYDKSGYNNVGTLNNGVGYSSTNGGTLVFDGTNDYVSIPYNSAFNIGTGDFSFNIWYYPNSDSSFLRLFTLGVFATAGNFQFERGYSGNITVHINGAYVQFNSDNPSGVWHNYTVTRISGTIYVYKNGVNFNSAVLNGTINSTSNLTVGNDTTYGVYFAGNIPLVSFYNRALSQAEITQNFNALRSRFGL